MKRLTSSHSGGYFSSLPRLGGGVSRSSPNKGLFGAEDTESTDKNSKYEIQRTTGK
jgi:hypothetical protein